MASAKSCLLLPCQSVPEQSPRIFERTYNWCGDWCELSVVEVGNPLLEIAKKCWRLLGETIRRQHGVRSDGLQKRSVLVSMKLFGFRRSKLFCRWFFCFLLGQRGVHIGCCLNPVEVSFLLFGFVWWLDCFLLKEGPSAFCSQRWLLEVFLAFGLFLLLLFFWFVFLVWWLLLFAFVSVLLFWLVLASWRHH